MPVVAEHLTAKKYIDQAISISVDEQPLVRSNQDSIFNNSNSPNIKSVNLNTHAIRGILVVIKS